MKGQSFEYEQSTLEQILNFYLEERLAILKCAGRLLQGVMDANFVYRNEAVKLIKQLIEDKWLDEVKAQYNMLTKAVLPPRLSRAFAERWATQYVLEQAAILEIILLLYYEAIPRNFKTFLDFCKLFSENAFGARQINYSALTELGRSATRRIKYLSTLILLETLDLESYSANEIQLNQDFLAVDQFLVQWGSVDAHGPILLAWSAILSRVGQVTMSAGLQNPVEGLVSYAEYGKRAMQLQAADFMLKLLQESSSEAREGTTLAHKSILSGWLVAITSAFFADDLPFYRTLVQLHMEIYRDEPILSNHFWRQYAEGSPLRGLLDLARDRFPFEFEPLLYLLTTLACDAHCATTVFFYLCELSTYLQTLSGTARGNIQVITTAQARSSLVHFPTPPFPLDDNFRYVSAIRAVEVDLITIQPGTIGRIMGVDNDGEPALIQWAHPHSAWHIFLSFIDTFMAKFQTYQPTISDADIATVTAIIELVAELFSKQPLMASSVQDHLIDLVSQLFGVLPTGNEFAILPRLVQILHSCAYLSRPPLALLTAALKCIQGIAHIQPDLVWHYFRRGLIEVADQNMVGPIDGPVRHALEFECASGVYPVTQAWLDLAEVLIAYLQKWPTESITSPQAQIAETDTSDFMPCLLYIQTALFSQYESWRYTSLQDKSLLGLRILRIFEKLLDDVPRSASQQSTPTQTNNFFNGTMTNTSTSTTGGMETDEASKLTLQEYLFNSLLYDVSFHTNILNIISIGPVALEFNQRRVKNGSTFVELVKSAFGVIESVLLLKQRAHDPSSSTSDMAPPFSATAEAALEITPLESSILQRKVGKNGLDLVYIIASYISYNYNPVIVTKATEVLTILSGLTKPTSVDAKNDLGKKSDGKKSDAKKQTLDSRKLSAAPTPGPISTAPISLVSYFGSMADTLRSEFLWKLSDNREPSALRISIWRLITEALASQPGLAELFINIQTEPVEPISSPETTTAKPGAAPTKERPEHAGGVPKSCVSVVLQMFIDDDQRNWHLKHDPRLLSEALAFLMTLWHVASDHFAIFSQIRGRNHFWTKLVQCLTVPSTSSALLQDVLVSSSKSQPPTTPSTNYKVETASKPVAVDSSCYRVLVNAHVFNIMALEIFFVSKNGELDTGLVSELRKLLTSDKTILKLLDDTSLASGARELLIKTLHWLKIDMTSLSHFVPYRVYGSEYLFDIALLRKKLGLGVLNAETTLTSVDHFTNETIDVMERIELANMELSSVDSKLQQLCSVQHFLQMVLLRQPSLGLPEADTLLMIAKLLSLKIGHERRESVAALNVIRESAELVLFIIRQWARQAIAALRKKAASTTSSDKSKPNSMRLPDSDLDAIYTILCALHDALFLQSSRKSSAPVCETLLTILHTVLNSISVWNEKIQSVAILISNTCIELLEQPALFHIALSLLTTIAAHTDQPAAMLRCLSERNTLGVLVSELSSELSTQTKPENAEAILYFFLALVNASPDMSEALSSHRVVRCLCVEPWVTYVRDHMTAYAANGERNVSHRVWTLSLALITRLLRVLGYWEDSVALTLEFVSTHATRLLKALDTHATHFQSVEHKTPDVTSTISAPSHTLAPSYVTSTTGSHQMPSATPTKGAVPPSPFGLKRPATALPAASTPKHSSKPILPTSKHLFGQTPGKSSGIGGQQSTPAQEASAITCATLEETERVTALVFQVGHYRNQWRLALETPHGNLADRIEQRILQLFQRVSLLVSHHDVIVSTAKAISSQERKSLVTTSTQKTATSKAPSSTSSAATSTPSVNGAAPAAGAKKVQFSEIPAIKVIASNTKTDEAKHKDAAPSTEGSSDKDKQKTDKTDAKDAAEDAKTDDGSAAKKKPMFAPIGGEAPEPSEATTAGASSSNAPASRSLAQSQMIVRSGDPAKPSNPAAPSPPKEVSFHERVELSLFRILRNTISLVRLFTPAVFSATDAGKYDEELMMPVFDPTAEAAIAQVPTLGLLSYLVSTCVSNMKKLTFVDGQADDTLSKLLSNPSSPLTPNRLEQLSLVLYVVETSVYILVAHIHLYLAPQNPDELIRRRVRDEIGYELESTISRLMKDWNRFSLAPIPALLQKAQQYLQSLQRR